MDRQRRSASQDLRPSFDYGGSSVDVLAVGSEPLPLRAKHSLSIRSIISSSTNNRQYQAKLYPRQSRCTLVMSASPNGAARQDPISSPCRCSRLRPLTGQIAILLSCPFQFHHRVFKQQATAINPLHNIYYTCLLSIKNTAPRYRPRPATPAMTQHQPMLPHFTQNQNRLSYHPYSWVVLRGLLHRRGIIFLFDSPTTFLTHKLYHLRYHTTTST